MKRVSNIYHNVWHIRNLILADNNARKGKVQTYGVKAHDKSRGCNLITLQNLLMSGSYKTSAYTTFKIFEPKERDIHRLPYFPDRICHHAVMNVLEPIWVSVFTRDTYSCIKSRGIHAAVRKIKDDLIDKDGTQYCLKLDIRKYYPSINHQTLKGIIRRKIKDKALLTLLDEIIDSAEGVPIGNYLSQYFANLYLAYFDHWIKEEKKIKYYYRYADDIVILSHDKPSLHSILSEIRQHLEGLKLDIKSNYQVFPVSSRGIDFVGYRFYHSHILLRKSIKKSFARKAKSGNIKSLAAYYGWAVHCNSRHLLKKLLKHESKQNPSIPSKDREIV